MALLTSLPASARMPAAMASSNWKRPWAAIDEHDTTTARDGRTSHSLSASSSSRDQDLRHDTSSSPYAWHVHSRRPTLPSFDSASHARSVHEAVMDNGYPSSSSHTGYKRPRLCATEPISPVQTRLDTPMDRKPSLGTSTPSTPLPPISAVELPPREPSAIDLASPESWRVPAWHDRSNASQEKGKEGAQTATLQCVTCGKVSACAPRIVEGLNRLHTELTTLWSNDAQSMDRSKPSTGKTNSYFPRGLLDSLDWSLEKLNDSIELARGMLGSKRTQEKEHDNHPTAGSVTQEAASSRQAASLVDVGSRRSDRTSSKTSGDLRRPGLPPLHLDDRNRRASPNSAQESQSYCADAPPLPPPQSAIHPAQSSHSSLPLPSPSSLNFSSGATSTVLPPMSSPSLLSHRPPTPSTSACPSTSSQPHSPRTTHLRELQHQLSTKSLAHGVLASEHEKLLSAYSRSQARCSTLDRKANVSETEIANLVEDRIRLQGQLEMVEEEVARLQLKQEENYKREREERDQWLRIIKGSEQLQRRHLFAERLWREDVEGFKRVTNARDRDQRQPDRAGRGIDSVGAMDALPPIKWEPGTSTTNDIYAHPEQGSETDEQLRNQLRMWQSKAEIAERKNDRYRTELSGLQRIVGELAGIDARLTDIGRGSNA